MRKPLFIANWKMNLTVDQNKALVDNIFQLSCINKNVDVVVCPSYTNIPMVSNLVKNSSIVLGAQDVSWEEKGSMTGEVSPRMLQDFSVNYVIVGHSERRGKMGETDEMVNKKVKACLNNNLIPVICVGETGDERREGKTDQVIIRQISKALYNIDLRTVKSIVIAYEPIWVIGTGRAVNAQEAEHVTRVINGVIHDLCHIAGCNMEDFVTILYGGSVTSDNVRYFVKENIDGVLVGGASLEAQEFCNIIKALS